MTKDGIRKYIVQYPAEVSLCAGCNACEIVCGLVHEGKVGPPVRRIFLEQDTILLEHRVYTCQHCPDYPCYNACPEKGVAMHLDEGKGIVYIDPEGCDGCQLCVEACPFEPKRINFEKSSQKAIKCDMCRTREKGPACVEYCQVRCLGVSEQSAPSP